MLSKKFVIVIICVLIIAGILLRPKSMTSNFIGRPLFISVTAFQLEDGQPVQNTWGRQLDVRDEGYQQVMEVLDRYRCHRSFTGLAGDKGVEGNTYTLVLTNGEETLVITDRGLLLEDRLYRVGYLNHTSELELILTLLDVLLADANDDSLRYPPPV